MAASLKFTSHRYGTSHALQTVCTWEFPPVDPSAGGSSASPGSYWLVYIHGGVWRDPRTTAAASFPPAIDALLSSPPPSSALQQQPRIAGFASISYRLSAHPAYPQDPAATDPYELRDAKHPDHIADVRAALAWLGAHVLRPSSSSSSSSASPPVPAAPYVLAGHSCGAFLALQVLMGGGAFPDGVVADDDGGLAIPAPAAVVGLDGLYDLRGLNARFGGAYAALFEGPFGADGAGWDAVSPARWGGWGAALRGGEGDLRLLLLAWSTEDELIDEDEVDGMARVLREAVGEEEKKGRPKVVVMKDLKGSHDDVWEGGVELARVLRRALEALAGTE